MKFSTITLLVVLFAVAINASCPNWVLYKQCDDEWGSYPLGSSTVDTICSAGCAMSSVSMSLASYGATLGGDPVNPGTLNKYLLDSNGYVDTDLIIWDSVAPLGIYMSSYVETLALQELHSLVDDCHPIIVNVRNGTHWVLVTGYDPNDDQILYVNDPGFEQDTYQLASVLKFVVYNANSTSIATTEFENQSGLRFAHQEAPALLAEADEE